MHVEDLQSYHKTFAMVYLKNLIVLYGFDGF